MWCMGAAPPRQHNNVHASTTCAFVSAQVHLVHVISRIAYAATYALPGGCGEAGDWVPSSHRGRSCQQGIQAQRGGRSGDDSTAQLRRMCIRPSAAQAPTPHPSRCVPTAPALWPSFPALPALFLLQPWISALALTETSTRRWCAKQRPSSSSASCLDSRWTASQRPSCT